MALAKRRRKRTTLTTETNHTGNDNLDHRGDNMTFEKAQVFFDKSKPYMSHTDVVVAQRPGEIDVIGGNVRDSVTKKTIPLTARGLIADRSHPWFVVLRRR